MYFNQTFMLSRLKKNKKLISVAQFGPEKNNNRRISKSEVVKISSRLRRQPIFQGYI